MCRRDAECNFVRVITHNTVVKVALCFLSVCLHEDIIVILCPVSLSVVWHVRVTRIIWCFYLIRGFRFLGFLAVIFL